MTAAICIEHFFADDFSVSHFIDLKLFGVTKMLKNLSIFIGNCKFHIQFSFLCVSGLDGVKALRPAASAAVGLFLSGADTVIAACDAERFPVDKACRQLHAGIFIDFLHGGTGNIHLGGALFVRLLF